jgi:hypothetical protein
MLQQLRLVMIISIIVLAGDDIYLSNNQTTAGNCNRMDPDGFILSQEWTKITGGFALVAAPTALQPTKKH